MAMSKKEREEVIALIFGKTNKEPQKACCECYERGYKKGCIDCLSGYKLEKIGEMMKIEKLGDFDYSKIRHSRTPLTPREYEYCIHDVKIVTAYIKQKIKEEHNNISEIPLTKTGYVRRYVRGKTIHGNNGYNKCVDEQEQTADEITDNIFNHAHTVICQIFGDDSDKEILLTLSDLHEIIDIIHRKLSNY